MEKQLNTLSKSDDSQELENYVQNLSIQKICDELSEICLKENGPETLQTLFKGLSNSAICQEKRAKISKEVLSTIQNKLISTRQSNKLVNVIAVEIDGLSTSHLISLVNSSLQMIQTGQQAFEERQESSPWWKDLIPRILNIIVENETVEHNGTFITGTEYKSEVVTAICMNEWKNSMVTNVASMFIDIPLSPEEHLKVVYKLCRYIQKIKLDEIPPLVHQILLLTKEQHGMHLFVALADFFDTNLYAQINCESEMTVSQIVPEDGTPLKELQIIEGTVLYHIQTAATSLGSHCVKEFLKTLKESLYHPQFVLRPFFVTLLLSISRITYTFEEEVLSILKSAISRCNAEEEKIFESAWLESVVPGSIKVEETLNRVVANCCRDRDRILKSLVTLGFTLLATIKLRGRDAQCENIWRLGSSLLVNLIQKYPHVTETVLTTLVDQISQVHESTQYTDCLARIARKKPLTLLDCSSIILQLLGSVCVRLPGSVGQRVLAAVLPLSKMSSSLRDNLMVFLRKALFSDKSSREMAVYGFLELLKDLRITDVRTLSQSMSQNYVGMSQIFSGSCSSARAAISNEGMCMEILSILKQVFDHHEQVKVVKYKGVYDCFYVNPKLGIHILANLRTQLNKYYDEKEIPPLNFHSAVVCQGTKIVVQEPIAYLVFGIALIAAKMNNSDKGDDNDDDYDDDEDFVANKKFIEMLDSMCERMSESDIPHFGFDKESGTNLPGDDLEVKLKKEKIVQILGVYEALMGYVLCSWKPDSLEHGMKLSSLFKGYSRLCDYAKGLGKPDKKKPDGNKRNSQKEQNKENKSKEKGKTKLTSTILNFKCASRLLCVLNGSPVKWASSDSTELIKGKRDLHRYAFNVTLELISQTRLLTPSQLSRSKYILQYVSNVGRVLYLRCLSRLPEIKVFDPQCALLALECFHELLTLACFHFKSKLTTFFKDIGVASEDLKLQLKTIVDVVLGQVEEFLKEDFEEDESKEETQTKKLSLSLITIASFLINQMSRGPLLQQVLSKVKQICKETKIENPNVAKALLSLLLNVYTKYRASGGLMLDLALCLCDNMSLIDDEMEVETHEKYEVINAKTAASCLTAICESVRVLVNEVDWMMSRFKAELSVLSLPAEEPLETRRESLQERERELCRHLNFSIKILSTICTLSVPPGPPADMVLKEVGNLYTKLVTVTKYFIVKVTKHHQTLPSTKFEKTVKMADHELTKNMYCFTDHVIADGAASAEEPPLKKQKKDAAALRNKVMKETKFIPKIIYEKEQFQKFVLQLSNKSKFDLEMKYTMARDYRLYTKQVKEIIEKENVHLEEEGMEVDENDPTQAESTQASKRMKTQE